MDLLKAKIFLDKVNREFARMSKDPENIARIDIDIMQSYLRELYDAFLSDPTSLPPVQSPKADSRRTVAPRQSQMDEPPAPTPSEPPAVVPPPPPKVETVVPPPPPEEKPAPAQPPAPAAPPPVEYTPPPPPPPPVVEYTPPPPPPPAPPVPSVKTPIPEADILFEFKEAKELSEKLSEAPITDLRRAIALNDKLLLTKELFGGDSQIFENAVMNLNNFSGFDAAKAYMLENLVGQFDWVNSKKMETAKKFIKLVRRRYK